MDESDFRKYQKHNMSKESAKDFLETHGRTLIEYEQIFLVAQSFKSPSYESCLEELTRLAIDKGCEYVASVDTDMYAPRAFVPTVPETGKVFKPYEVVPAVTFMTGTGLIPKDRTPASQDNDTYMDDP